MGLPTMIQANMTSEQLEAYTLHLRIEEISQKLRINDVVPAEGDRYVLPHPFNGFSNSAPDLLRRRLSTITSVAESTLASSATASGSKMNVTS